MVPQFVSPDPEPDSYCRQRDVNEERDAHYDRSHYAPKLDGFISAFYEDCKATMDGVLPDAQIERNQDGDPPDGFCKDENPGADPRVQLLQFVLVFSNELRAPPTHDKRQQ